jgi:hypothetical protein
LTRPDALAPSGPKRPRVVYGSFDETRHRRRERTGDLATWHDMLLDRFAGTPEDHLLDRLVASPALGGPEFAFLRARIAERRGDTAQAAALVTECLKELPGSQEYQEFAMEVGAPLPPRAREMGRACMGREVDIWRPERSMIGRNSAYAWWSTSTVPSLSSTLTRSPVCRRAVHHSAARRP